ncbi:GumC family protein [Devosia sp. SL43]|uniref:GumC family protein n=1 Tax=Devosia sp. SL43 TaxID=2806348 RepID=UPI001F21B40E|nr:GumC family protein [Devosia sp. SL43]UJW85895.1 GumC family protein [Devosia sp. SL43]
MAYESQAVRDARIDVGAVLGAVVKRLPRVILLTVLLLAATFAILMFMPRLYESSASILVEPRSNIYTRAANEQAPSLTGGEAGVVSSQIELIKSRDTLMKVIDQLDLRSVPEFNGSGGGGFSPLGLVTQLLGRKSAPVSIDETVLSNLYERLTVIQERDSRIISVLVRSTDPQRAADIANAVANAHVARRAQLSLSDTAEASGWLLIEIERLRGVVNAAETKVADFKVDNDLFTGSNNTSLLDQQLSAIAAQINSAQERKATALSRATLIRGMLERGQSIEGVADVRDSVVIQQLSEEKARLQGEKAQRSATLLANHPTIQALTAQINELNNQITIEGRRVADALDAEAQIEADLEVSLQADLTRAKGTASTATQDTVTLDGLQREAKAQRDLLEGYLQRYNEAFSRTETSSALPDVRVVTLAAPSVTPASPKTQLVLLAVGIVSVATQVGLIVFAELMSGRAIVPGRALERPQDELDEVPFSEDELEPDQIDAVAPEVAEAPATPEPVARDQYVEPQLPAPVAEATPAMPPATSNFVRTMAEDVEAVVPRTPAAEPAAEPVAARPARREPRVVPGMIALSDLASDLVLGRTHLVILAGHRSNADCEALAEELVGDALARGLSVALVDAGSALATEETGLTDLSTEAASFGDVVHKSADNSFAEVPWGRGRAISRQSSKPLTLVEALGDIYEVVVLMTGPVGMASTLPLFESLDGRLVLVAGDEDEIDAVAETREQLLDAGFAQVEIAALSARVAA